MIIKTAMNSHPLRFSGLLFSTVLLLMWSTALFASDKTAPPAKPAGEYAAFDAHANEKVTVAAEPCTKPEDCAFFRLAYIQHGFLPVRVIFTNDGDTALSLDDARIQFIGADKQKIQAATDEDLQRRLFSLKDAKGKKIPLPMPLPPITLHGKPTDQQITKDEDDFGFKGTVVNAHSTLAGYLFYDTRELDGDPLKGAEIFVKMVHTLDGKKQLFDFNVPLDKWLAAQAKTQ